MPVISQSPISIPYVDPLQEEVETLYTVPKCSLPKVSTVRALKRTHSYHDLSPRKKAKTTHVDSSITSTMTNVSVTPVTSPDNSQNSQLTPLYASMDLYYSQEPQESNGVITPTSSQELPSTQEITPPPSPVLRRSQPLKNHPPDLAPQNPILPPDTVVSSPPKFRFRAKSLFYTAPRNATEPAVVLNRALDMWGTNVSFAVVSKEKHQDGTPHLHAMFLFHQRLSGASARFADFLSGSHGHVRYVKNIKACYRYIVKDGCFVVHGDAPPCLVSNDKDSQEPKPLDELVEKLKGGTRLQTIFEDYGRQFFLYGNRIKQFHSTCRKYAAASALLPWGGVEHSEISVDDAPSQVVVDWLNQNLFKDRRPKQPQLFICGPPNIGKTYLIETLRKFCRVYSVPMLERFMDDYNDDDYDLVIFEEFRGQKTISEMNNFLDGSPCNIAIKGAQYLKMKNQPCIILSNYALTACYKHALEANSMAIDSLETRLVQADYLFYNPPLILEELNSSLPRNATLEHPNRRFRMTFQFNGLFAQGEETSQESPS